MNDKNANLQTPGPSRKRALVPGAVTPNLYSAAKRRRMSLADEDEREFEAFGGEFGHTGKVDVVRLCLYCCKPTRLWLRHAIGHTAGPAVTGRVPLLLAVSAKLTHLVL